jgi:CHAT domain-containing protein/predicted negative regulator of RcsB-dependent stress response
MRCVKLRWTRSGLLPLGLTLALGLSAFAFVQVDSRAQSAASASSEGDDLRPVVEKYFAACNKKDLAGVVALWSEKSPNLAPFKQSLQRQFTNEEPNYGSPAITRVRVEKERACLQARVAQTSINLKARRQSDRRLIINFELVNEAGAWKVWRCAPAEEDLAGALVKMDGQTERVKLLAQEKELATVELGQALLIQGEGLSSQGLFAQATEICELALRLAEQLGETSLKVNALLALGRVDEMCGNYSQALERYQQSLKIVGDIGDRLGMARALNNLGNVHDAQGNYTEAARLYQQSLKIAEDLDDRTFMARVLNNLGNIYEQWGDYTLALEQYQKSLKIKAENSDRAGMATTLNNIGNVHVDQGNYAQALELFRQSLKIAQELDIKEGIAMTLANIGNVHLRQGNEAQALGLYRQSLKIAEELGIKEGVAHLLTNIGDVHFEQGDYTQAVERFEQSLKTFDELGDQSRVALTLSNLGNVYLAQSNYGQALELFRQSLKISEDVKDKANMVQALNNLASVHQAQGSYTLALQSAQRAADIATRIGATEDASQAQTAAGKAYFALNQLDQARLSFDEAIASIETLRAQVAGGEEEQQRSFESKISPYYAMVELLVAQRKPDEALSYAERAKARVLLDVLSYGRVNITKAMTVEEQQQERQLNGQLSELNSQLYREKLRPNPDPARLARLEDQLQSSRLDFEAFQFNLYAAHPELKTRRGAAPPLGLAQAGDLLPDVNTALLEFVVADEKTYLFVLTKSGAVGVKVYPLEIKQKDLADRVARFRQMLSTSDNSFSKPAHELYGLLVKPAAAQLRGKTRLLIVPDGALWELPFQALQTPQNRYLIDDHIICYAPSLTALREMINVRRMREAHYLAAPTLLAMGDPALGLQHGAQISAAMTGEGLDPLPEARRQVQTLARIYGRDHSKIYVGPNASEERFKAEAEDYDILHLATHGILNDRNPMYSHLLLAQPSDAAEEDGLLEARELMKMELRANLVTLSACETARGRVSRGEGMIGLTWALFVAGAPTTVVSQWKVKSDSTAQLMIEFHRQLKSRPTGSATGSSAAEALRAAALKLKRDSWYRHPFHWAGFIVVGAGY